MWQLVRCNNYNDTYANVYSWTFAYAFFMAIRFSVPASNNNVWIYLVKIVADYNRLLSVNICAKGYK
ncbi:hypothetical protein HMPREF1870_01393 [Bacteroidales bacterium KA00344]|nr:hypothetical protein HMPREF1870_01393 [Bacteroidales bacterium KA00344]